MGSNYVIGVRRPLSRATLFLGPMDLSLSRHLAIIGDEAEQTATLLSSAELPAHVPATLPEQIRQRVQRVVAREARLLKHNGHRHNRELENYRHDNEDVPDEDAARGKGDDEGP